MTDERKCAVVFGGSGALGQAVLSVLKNRGIELLVGTYQRNQPDCSNSTIWQFFDARGVTEPSKFVPIGSSLITMIYCIGESSSKQGATETPLDEWNSLIEINATGFARAFGAIAREARQSQASVVAIGSDTTRALNPKNGPYSASKAALEALVTTMAKEERAYGVRLNVLAPCLIDSPLADRLLQVKEVSNKEEYLKSLPWGRMLSLTEVAEAAVSLALDTHWRYASGQVFRLAAA